MKHQDAPDRYVATVARIIVNIERRRLEQERSLRVIEGGKPAPVPKRRAG